ncbi:MAG TPA: sodium:proton exchanger [Acidimicrobiia bacterium]|nr:sodium:proton exchanger [Acidimicrobiia bacterium]
MTELKDTELHAGREVFYVILAMAAMVPGVYIRVTGTHADPVLGALLFGVAIVGAAFMLSWAAEIVQLDISGGLALALLALIAVLPEYAVDFVFAWKAGTDLSQAPNALANMTGGNQLLIGFGWPLVVLLATWRIRRLRVATQGLVGGADEEQVVLAPIQSVDIAFLSLATIYGLFLPLRSSLTLVDALVLVAIYVGYLMRLSRAPAGIPHLVGPAALVGQLPTRTRRALNIAFFIIAAGVILAVAEPFAESLVELGQAYDIPEFLLVKWLAPLASESPELLVAALFAWRLQASTGLGALVSSKVNQWTLLVGTLPLVFVISSSIGRNAFSSGGLPLGPEQQAELFVTAAQSVFAVAVLSSRSMDRKEAWVLFGLFVAQFAESIYVSLILDAGENPIGRVVVGIVFLVAAAWVISRNWRLLSRMVIDGLRKPINELLVED